VTTTLERQEHPVPAQKPGEEKNWRVGRALLLLGVLGMAIGAIVFGGRTVTLRDEKESAVQQATSQGQQKDNVAERAIAVCKGATPEELAKLNGVGLCVAAAQAKNEPAPTTAAPVPFSVVKSAVDAYMAANPPAAGPPPAPEVVLQFVRQVYDANKPADGKDGQNGQDGRNARCFDVPDDPACQPKQGAPGVSVVDIQLDDSNGCELVVLFSNDTSTRKPVNPALCGPAAPPTATETQTETATVTADPPLPLPTS
jgi:hypothetical protein